MLPEAPERAPAPRRGRPGEDGLRESANGPSRDIGTPPMLETKLDLL